jgi:hypothetical protein
MSAPAPKITRLAPLELTLLALAKRCPLHVDEAAWHRALADGDCFLAQWGGKAEGLGWTVRDLFGLAPIPDKPHPRYRRLARYDETGLIWLLRGRPVFALTKATASLKSATGMITVYRRHNKPALGPLGDSLDDL